MALGSFSSSVSATCASAHCLIQCTSKDIDIKEKDIKIFLVDDDEERLCEMQSLFPHAHTFFMESPIQKELIAKKIAWKAALNHLEFKCPETDFWFSFIQMIKETHLAAHLLLSDSADFGITHIQSRILRGNKIVRNGLYLKDAFANVPAIIVGAGPSLKKNMQHLVSLKEKALIFAGGNALSALPIEPHFAANIDPKAPYHEAKRYPYGETPFCFQSRINPENFSLIHGEALWFPENHHRFLNWIDGFDETFDGGWTVGTFLTKIAYFLGCSPIILVGMDLCYLENEKYSHRANDPLSSIRFEKVDGKTTQADWMMARNWLQALSSEGLSRKWIDARGDGLPLGDGFQKISLHELKFNLRENLRQNVYEKIHRLPQISTNRLKEWEMSLKRCLDFTNIENEIVYDLLLTPLWQIFSPLIDEGDMELHRFLFFQRIIQEHLHAIEMAIP